MHPRFQALEDKDWVTLQAAIGTTLSDADDSGTDIPSILEKVVATFAKDMDGVSDGDIEAIKAIGMGLGDALDIVGKKGSEEVRQICDTIKALCTLSPLEMQHTLEAPIDCFVANRESAVYRVLDGSTGFELLFKEVYAKNSEMMLARDAVDCQAACLQFFQESFGKNGIKTILHHDGSDLTPEEMQDASSNMNALKQKAKLLGNALCDDDLKRSPAPPACDKLVELAGKCLCAILEQIAARTLAFDTSVCGGDTLNAMSEAVTGLLSSSMKAFLDLGQLYIQGDLALLLKRCADNNLLPNEFIDMLSFVSPVLDHAACKHLGNSGLYYGCFGVPFCQATCA